MSRDSIRTVAYQSVTQSGQTIFRYLRELISAIPASFGNQISNPKAPNIIFQTSQIFLYDLLPMMIVYWMHLWILSLNTAREEKTHCGPIEISLGVFSVASYLFSNIFIMRKQIGFFVHVALLACVYPKALHEATDITRKKIITDVCKSCTTARYMKGELRSLIAYRAQLLVIQLLEFIPYALGFFSRISGAAVAGEYLGNFLGFFSRIALVGQWVGEYRLMNDGLCDRHRMEYFHQHWELFFALGIFHYVSLKGVMFSARVILPESWDLTILTEPLSTLFVFYLLALMHYATVPTEKNKRAALFLPDAVLEAKRHFYDPTLSTRWLVTKTMDLIIPGVIKKFDDTIDKRHKKQKRKSARIIVTPHAKTDMHFELIEAEQSFVERLMIFYQRAGIQFFATLVLPRFCRSFDHFKQDFIIRELWLPIAKKLTELSETLLRLKSVALTCASLLDFYEEYVMPAQEYAGVLSCLTPIAACADKRVIHFAVAIVSQLSHVFNLSSRAGEATKIISKHSQSFQDIHTLFAGVPRGVVIIAIAFLRNKVFMQSLEERLTALRKITYTEEMNRAPSCFFTTAETQVHQSLSKIDSWDTVANDDKVDSDDDNWNDARRAVTAPVFRR